MTKVVITEKATGRVAAIVQTVVRGANFTPNERDYFDTAWESVVEDKVVDAKRWDAYSFAPIP